jgi:5'-nucleotidase
MSIPKLCSLPLLLALAVVGLGAPAQAAPPTSIGTVQNHTASVAAAPGGYLLTSSWTALSGAAAYDASVTNASGAVLASARVTSPPWKVNVTGAPGTNLKVTVTPVPLERKKRGMPSDVIVNLPDLTAPAGAFTVSTSGQEATITQQSLSDDATPAASISRIVTWGDGSAAQTWSAGTTLSHSYGSLGRFVPSIRLADASGNAANLTLKAAVFGDTVAPVGNYAVAPTSKAFARWTKVSLSVLSLNDNYSPAEFIERTVAWGDGSVETWPAGTPLAHMYASGGTFTPAVVMVDEAGNSSRADLTPVAVTVDSTGPAVKIAAKKSARVAKWRTVRGSVVDAGVGAAQVSLVAIEKRGSRWFSYNAGTHKWIGAKSKAKAWKAAKPALAVPAAGQWKVGLAGLRKGTLKLRVTGTDNLGNRSAVVGASRKLTKA